MTLLEVLPNEILFKIFKYLTIVDIFHSFHNLNSRFEKLISEIYKTMMGTISDRDLDIIHQKFPTQSNQSTPVLNLRIKSENLEYLFSRGFNFDQFENLQSLVLDDIQSFERFKEILSQLENLTSLTHLKISELCHESRRGENSFDWIDYIWKLSKLTHFFLHDTSLTSRIWVKPSTTSLTIVHLSIKINLRTIDILDCLFRCTPKLQYLQLHQRAFLNGNSSQLTTISESLINLELILMTSSEVLEDILGKLPNLENLILRTSRNFDGNKWKTIITEKLPRIRKFQLNMLFYFDAKIDKETQVDGLLNSFRTSFRIERRQCFFRCKWNQSTLDRHCLLYTLPGIIGELDNSEENRFKSTCSNDRLPKYYDRIETYRYCYEKMNSSENLPLFYPNISSIRHLEINLPFNENIFLKYVPKLNQVYSLSVKINDAWTYDQLQPIIDQAPHLDLLTIDYSFNLSITLKPLITIHSESIRQLKFIKRSMDKIECADLSRSSLGSQCQILIISLQDYKFTLDLINNMLKLRLLIFKYQKNQNQSTDEVDTIIPWLYHNLSSMHPTIDYSKETTYYHLTIERFSEKS